MVEIREDSKTPVGIGCIDELLEGGIEKGILSEIYGEGGAGKTNIALQFSVNCSLSGRTIYIDTEGFSYERYSQISSGMEESRQNFVLYQPEDIPGFEATLIKIRRSMERGEKFVSITVDSLTSFIRVMQEDSERNTELQRIISLLSDIARKFYIPVFATNQVYFDPQSSDIVPYGGYLLNHFAKSIYSVRRRENGKRDFTVMKHRSIKDGKFTSFFIVQSGIICAGTKDLHSKTTY